MGSWIFIPLLLGFVAFVLPIILWVRVSRLEDRVRGIRAQIKGLAERTNAPAAPQGTVELGADAARLADAGAFQPAATPLPLDTAEAVSKEEVRPTFDIVAWFREDWLLKLGAILLLLAFGWFVTYAFLNNWIGPVGRITLGLLAGAGILLLGWWRVQTYLRQGSLFLVLGSTVILLTVYAARTIYEFFNPPLALGIMFLSTAFIALASVRFQNERLAVGSVMLAAVAPLLTHSPAPDYIGLFAYLAAVVLGSLWIAALTDWRAPALVALAVIAAYSLPHISGHIGSDRPTLLLFGYAFSGIFFLANALATVRDRNPQKNGVADVLIAVGNGLLLLGWILSATEPEWRSLVISAWMVVFGAGAFVIFRATGRPGPFYAHAGVGVAMLAAATSEELSGASLTIAYTIESALVPILVYLYARSIRPAMAWCLLFVGPVLLAFDSMRAYAWRQGVWHEHFFVLAVLSAALFGAGYFFRREIKTSALTSPRFDIALMVTGSGYAYIVVWRALHAAFRNDDWAVLVALTVYTLVGLASYLFGRMNDRRVFHRYGGALLGLVVARLLVVDVWNMDLVGRIVTFFLIGALLMSTAFIGRTPSGAPPNGEVSS